MRHKKKFNHLGRKRGHRKAMLSNMAVSLIMHKRIKTTTAKAKALKAYIEPMITKAKEDTTHSRRTVFSYLQDKEAVTELFREVIAKIGDRPGGYTRIIKLGARLGDSAEMCIIELVDYNENLLAEKAAASKSRSRRRRGGSKKTTETAADTEVADAPASDETVLAEEEAAPEAVADAPAAEAADEAPAAEDTEEVKKDAPAEEKKDEPKAEAEEAPAEDAKEEEKPEADEEKKAE